MPSTTDARIRARAARDAAIAAVARGSGPWRAYAEMALWDAARREATLTSDDVWLILTDHGVPSPDEPRAMGPVMLAGVRYQWIEATDQFLVTETPATHRNHGRPQRIYRSLIVSEAALSWPARLSVENVVAPAVSVSPLRPAARTEQSARPVDRCPKCGEAINVTYSAIAPSMGTGHCWRCGKVAIRRPDPSR